MTLLGGAVYAGFFAVAALWLVATNPDAADEQVQVNSADQDRAKASSAAGAPVGF